MTEALYEEARQSRLSTEKFMLDGRHTGTGGGNHVTLGGATRRGQPAAAPAGPAAKPRHVLAEPSGAVVPVLRDVHRTDEPVAARRRSARRPPLRARDRVPADAAQERGRRGDDHAVARRPAAAPPAHRPHRQHASRRVLDRQAVLARHGHRPPRPARVSRVRDAAASRG